MPNKYKRLFHYILFIVLIAMGANIIMSISNVKKGRNRLVEVQNQIDEQQKLRASLEKKLEYVKSDEFLRKEALEKLNLTKPNEKILVIDPEILKDYQNIINNSDSIEEAEKPVPEILLWLKEFKLDKYVNSVIIAGIVAR